MPILLNIVQSLNLAVMSTVTRYPAHFPALSFVSFDKNQVSAVSNLFVLNRDLGSQCNQSDNVTLQLFVFCAQRCPHITSTSERFVGNINLPCRIAETALVSHFYLGKRKCRFFRKYNLFTLFFNWFCFCSILQELCSYCFHHVKSVCLI